MRRRAACRWCLLESEDFAKGTSSRATKLVHGGVRYLAQGDIGLVHEALHERSTLLANAPQVAQRLAFVVPGYRVLDLPFYGAGLKMYDVLAGRQSLGPTEMLSARRTQELLPTVRRQGLVGGIKYWDGQFDDARLAVLLARTAITRGAVVLNHCRRHRPAARGRQGARRCTRATPKAASASTLRARCVVNAAGVWVDAVRDMDREADAPPKPADGGAQPGRAPGGRPRLPARHACADGAEDQRRPRALCRALAGQDDPRHHRHAAPRPGPRAHALPRGGGLHPARGRPLSVEGADTRRRALGLGRPAPAGQAARRRRRQHQGAVARAHGAGRALRPGHRDRRQVDHLPRHGRGRARPLHGQRRAAATCRAVSRCICR